MEEVERLGQLLEEVADTMRGYLLMGERVEPNNAAFGFGEAKRIMREQVKKIDEAMLEEGS